MLKVQVCNLEKALLLLCLALQFGVVQRESGDLCGGGGKVREVPLTQIGLVWSILAWLVVLLWIFCTAFFQEVATS